MECTLSILETLLSPPLLDVDLWPQWGTVILHTYLDFPHFFANGLVCDKPVFYTAHWCLTSAHPSSRHNHQARRQDDALPQLLDL